MAGKGDKAKFEVVSSGSVAALAKNADASLVVAIGTYDALGQATRADLEKIFSQKEIQDLLKNTDKRVLIAIGTYDAYAK